MAEVQLTVAEFVRRTRSEPFVWGRCDCCLWPADFILAATGHDPAADLRCTYSSPFGARRIIMLEGGMVTMWGRRLAHLKAGAEVVLANYRGATLGGLKHGRHMFFRTEGDILMTTEAQIIAGWAV